MNLSKYELTWFWERFFLSFCVYLWLPIMTPPHGVMNWTWIYTTSGFFHINMTAHGFAVLKQIFPVHIQTKLWSLKVAPRYPWGSRFEQTWINTVSVTPPNFAFLDYLPLEEGVALHLNKLESPWAKDTLYWVWLKIAQWFWRRKWQGFSYHF